MIIKDNIVELVHTVIRSPYQELHEETLGELRGEWRNLTASQQEHILSDMRWWTAIARHTPTEGVKNFLKEKDVK